MTRRSLGLALALWLTAVLASCKGQVGGGTDGGGCANCGTASCGRDDCGQPCGELQGGCGTGQTCSTSDGTPGYCVTPVRPSCTTPPAGTPGNLVARIVVDEPAGYTQGENMCPPEDEPGCYFPDLGLSLTRGHAPFPVFFQGWSSTPRSDIVAWLWDFGDGTETDPHGRCFSGFNAAHVFETPGTYTVTLRVLNAAGNVASTTIPVTILPPSGTTYYVDAAIGDDACDGRSQTVDGATRCPWRSADKAFSSMRRPYQNAALSRWQYKPGDRILFRRGQSFDLTASVTMGYGFATQGYTFGAYGTGAKPVIQWRGRSGGEMIDTGLGFGYVGFVDLAFDFMNPDLGVAGQLEGLLAPICGAKNVFCLRCDFREPQNGAFATNGGECTGSLLDSSFFLVDSTVANPQTHATSVAQSYFFGVHGLALLNNTFDLSGNHVAYTSPIDKGLIWHNVHARPAFGRTAWRSIGGSSTLPDNNLWFAENQLLGWIDPIDAGPDSAHNGQGSRYNWHLVNLAPGSNYGELLIDDVVFERNVVTNFEGGMNVVNGRNVTIRNNLFVSPAAGSTFLTLSDEPGTPGLTRPLLDVKIVGNTFVATGTGDRAEFIRVHPWTSGSTRWGGNHSGVVIENNVFYARSGEDAVAVNLVGTDNGLLSGLRIDRNVVYVPTAEGGAPFQIAGTRHTLESWRAASGQDANTSAVDPRFAAAVPAVSYGPGEPSYQQGVDDVLGYEAALHLTAGSPLCGGEPFPVDSYFDFDLTPRFGGDACVDVGAYEYVAP